MKAILVVDMPNTCCECKLFWNDVDCGCMALGRVLGEFGCSVGKPIDCPLKPMPEKKILDEELFMFGNFRLIHARFTGWNDCIDTITGETE